MRRADSPPEFWSSAKGFAVFSTVVIVSWVANFFLFPYFFGNPDNVGVAGDMFGGLTALFSGLAFAGLLSTLLMQRRELELQREELALSRDEFMLQRFESTLFGLIRLLNDHVASLEVRIQQIHINFTHPSANVSNVHRGREALVYYARTLPSGVREEYQDDPERPGEVLAEMKTVHRTLEQQREEYLRRYEAEYEGDLGPYFRILYNTVRHVHLSNLEDVDKQKYSKIVRAYLSSAEVKLLMFNCCTTLGANFRSWVEVYALLKHIHPRDVKANRELVNFYSLNAFAGRQLDSLAQ